MAYEPGLVRVVASLEGVGLDVRVLKGYALASLDYPDLQQRVTGDIDLLVRGSDLVAAVAALSPEGATVVDPEPVPGYAGLVGKGLTLRLTSGVEVDLHRLLVWGPLGVRLPPDELWTTSRSFSVGGAELRTLGLEETLLHVAYHLVVGGTRRGLSVRDVGQLLVAPALDADRVLGLARRWGAEAVLAEAIVLTMSELDLQIDELGTLAHWASGFEPRWVDRAWLRIDRPEAALAAIEPLATFWELRTNASRRCLLAATVHPLAGTWPGPTERLDRVARRGYRWFSGTR